jgi:ParB family chromosome partitioning protein
MTTAAGNLEKEKVEKRRALGRGLESLLPGPRVVAPVVVRESSQPFAKDAKDGPASDSSSSPVRVGDIQAVVDNSLDPQSPPFAKEAKDGAPTVVEGASELRSDGQPRAAVPTQVVPTSTISASTHSTQALATHPPVAQKTLSISAQAEASPRVPGTQVVNIALELIDPNPYQTREVADDDPLEELANSIKANGVMQPIVVRPGENGRYVLVLGERRCKASIKIGNATIPAIVRRVSDQQAAEMTVIENLQRLDLTCLEQARAFRVLSQDFNLTQAQIGERVGLSRESISNYMRLLKLPVTVLDFMDDRKLGFSEARELLKLDDMDLIAKTADYIVKRKMTLDQIEILIMRMLGLLEPVPGMPGQVAKKSGARWLDPNVRAAQLDMERLLGVRVRIRDRKGKGRIVIEYSTVDDYERVVGMLRGKKN